MLALAIVLSLAQIDQIAAEAIRDGPKAGMSIAVVQRGQTIVSRGYGYANLELEAPATADTVYHIDSITKHLTGGAILRLVEQKKISLDDPITSLRRCPRRGREFAFEIS